jgi:hypothetical protein
VTRTSLKPAATGTAGGDSRTAAGGKAAATVALVTVTLTTVTVAVQTGCFSW